MDPKKTQKCGVWTRTRGGGGGGVTTYAPHAALRPVLVSLQGPAHSSALPLAQCVGSLLPAPPWGWFAFRRWWVSGAQSLVCWGRGGRCGGSFLGGLPGPLLPHCDPPLPCVRAEGGAQAPVTPLPPFTHCPATWSPRTVIWGPSPLGGGGGGGLDKGGRGYEAGGTFVRRGGTWGLKGPDLRSGAGGGGHGTSGDPRHRRSPVDRGSGPADPCSHPIPLGLSGSSYSPQRRCLNGDARVLRRMSIRVRHSAAGPPPFDPAYRQCPPRGIAGAVCGCACTPQGTRWPWVSHAPARARVSHARWLRTRMLRARWFRRCRPPLATTTAQFQMLQKQDMTGRSGSAGLSNHGHPVFPHFCPLNQNLAHA